MPLLVWTKKPDSMLIRQAAINAAVEGFLDRQLNGLLLHEVKEFLRLANATSRQLWPRRL